MASIILAAASFCAIVAVLLVYFDSMWLGATVLVVVLAVGCILEFAALSYFARLFVRSPVLAPFAAVKMQFKIMCIVAAYVGRGFKTLFPEWTFAYEVACKFMRSTFEHYGEVVAIKNAPLLQEAIRQVGEVILESSCRTHKTHPEKVQVHGMTHTWMRDNEKKQHRIIVIFYHGGGYAIADPLQDVELANMTHTMLQAILHDKYHLDVSVDVLLANYRKSTTHPYPTPLNDCLDMYKYVLKHEDISPDHVIVGGDSAGAEMSLTNCIRLRDSTPELLPLAALCYSPVVDFSETGGDELSPHCILPSAFADTVLASYLRDVKDPIERMKVSPINNSLLNLPPVFLQWGSLERFCKQGMRLKAKADAEGVTNIEVDILPNIVHDPVMFPSAVCPAMNTSVQHGLFHSLTKVDAIPFAKQNEEVESTNSQQGRTAAAR
ncbi:hypothetical protein ON010_g2965 [Phytophthora cinnamomi]|nr:hypothetical protein ON010_g2965 [Phytophthora cinnamomi]